MADPSYPRIGTQEWCKQMQWGWGIYTIQFTADAGRSPWEYPKPWVAFDADMRKYHHFATHAEATAYVRSQIDRLRPTD